MANADAIEVRDVLNVVRGDEDEEDKDEDEEEDDGLSDGDFVGSAW